jgi:hypothetical protein
VLKAQTKGGNKQKAKSNKKDAKQLSYNKTSQE